MTADIRLIRHNAQVWDGPKTVYGQICQSTQP